jgi:hypothetical protein
MVTAKTAGRLTFAAAIVACLLGAWIDDVGVSYRYARHLAEGAGLTWNVGGEPVEGYSNLLWVLMLSVGHLLGADIEIFSRALGLIFGKTRGAGRNRSAACCTYARMADVGDERARNRAL